MTYFLIINPGSNHKRSMKIIPKLLGFLKSRNIDFDYILTNTLSDAKKYSQDAVFRGYDVVVAVGGDGTINQVLNGFYDEHGCRRSKSIMGVIHTGTSPDFCLSYGIPINLISAMETLIKGFTREISIAQIEYQSKSSERITGYFACCASFGLGAQVALLSNSGIRKYLGDTLGTFVSIIISLFKYKSNDLEMCCDDQKVKIEKNFNTFIGKTSFIASGMKIAHQLSHQDSRLYLLTLKKITLKNLYSALKSIYSGREIENTNFIEMSYHKSIEIFKGQRNQQIEFDGDPQGDLPCKISIAQDRLELIVNKFRK